MAFTKALYYPWIDIEDEAWLKNAMLYWEEIQTIVPSSIEQPYSSRTAQEFYHEGLLSPLYVEPGMSNISELTDDVLKYLESSEGVELLMAKEISENRFIHPDKLPREIQEIFIYKEKLPYKIEHIMERIERTRYRNNLIRVDSRFADFYMTLLATHLAKMTGSGLLTDTAANNKLSTAVKLDGRVQISSHCGLGARGSRFGRVNLMDLPLRLAQGTLADLIIERIQIDPKTPVQDILKFRIDHADELGRFRTKIDELTRTLSRDEPIDSLRQNVYDIYINEVGPEINSLKKGLTESKIRWFIENVLKISFFSTSLTSVPATLLGLSIPYALLVGAGVSLTASTILYNLDKADGLRRNPYSYLLAVEKEFHRWDELG